MIEIPKQRLKDALQETGRHLLHMRHAMRDLADLHPLQANTLKNMDDERVRSMDQFIYRFTKLQDSLGLRLLPAILRVLGEPFEDWSMIDRLNRLEQLGFIESAGTWQGYHEIRNRLTHEDPDAPEIQAAVINMAWEAAGALHDAYYLVQNRLSEMDVDTTAV